MAHATSIAPTLINIIYTPRTILRRTDAIKRRHGVHVSRTGLGSMPSINRWPSSIEGMTLPEHALYVVANFQNSISCGIMGLYKLTQRRDWVSPPGGAAVETPLYERALSGIRHIIRTIAIRERRMGGSVMQKWVRECMRECAGNFRTPFVEQLSA